MGSTDKVNELFAQFKQINALKGKFTLKYKVNDRTELLYVPDLYKTM